MSTTESAKPSGPLKGQPFDPGDPLGIDDLLAPEDLAIRDTVRAWAADRVLPHIAEWYENGELPGIRELARELGSLGALGMSLRGYGCAGASAVQYGLACLELEAADSGIRSLVSVQGSLAMYAIHRFGSEEQKQRWLPAMAAGETIGCFGLTEPDHGSDPAGCGPTPSGTARTGSSQDARCGSPTVRSRGSPSSGRRPTRRAAARASAASSCRRTAPASPRPRSGTSGRCAPRSPASWSWTACGCPPTRSCPGPPGCAAR